jgi:hypothetical protein
MLYEHPFNWTCKCGHLNNDSFEPREYGPFIVVTCSACAAVTDISALSPVDQASYNQAYDYYAKDEALPTLERAAERIAAINKHYDALFGHRNWVNYDLEKVPGGSADLDELIELQEIVDAHEQGRKVSTLLLRIPA